MGARQLERSCDVLQENRDAEIARVHVHGQEQLHLRALKQLEKSFLSKSCECTDNREGSVCVCVCRCVQVGILRDLPLSKNLAGIAWEKAICELCSRRLCWLALYGLGFQTLMTSVRKRSATQLAVESCETDTEVHRCKVPGVRNSVV